MFGENHQITWKVVFSLYLLGLHCVSNIFIIINLQPVLEMYFGQNLYTLTNFLLNLPVLIVSPFVPFIIKKISISSAVIANFLVQTIVAAAYASIFYFIPADNFNFLVVYALIVFLVLISSSFFALTLNEYYYIATIFSDRSVTYVATGIASAGALTPLIFMAISKIIDPKTSYKNFSLIAAFYSILINIPASVALVHLYRIALENHEHEISTDPVIENGVYFCVLKKRARLLIINFSVFTLAFLCFPSIAYAIETKSGVYALATVYGFSEIVGRFVIMFDMKTFVRIYSKRNLYYFIFPFFALCLVPLFILMSQKNLFGKNWFFCTSYCSEIVVFISYILIALNIGLYGNSLTKYICSDLNNSGEYSVACCFSQMTNIAGMTIGSLCSFLFIFIIKKF